MGRSTSYTLRYDHSDDGSRLDWELLRGDIMRRLDGSYVLTPVTGDGDRTPVTYHLDVELVVPLPGFVKRRAESKIIHCSAAGASGLGKSATVLPPGASPPAPPRPAPYRTNG